MDRQAMKERDARCRDVGFTLIEMLLVMVILVALAAVVVPKFTGRSEEANVTAANTTIANLEVALDAFEVDTGRYPTTTEGLKALVEEPSNLQKWKGPYIRRDVADDPWGNPYIYRSPGKEGSYDLFSYGADGSAGGDGPNGDITS